MPLDAVSLVQALAVDGDDVEGMLVVGLDCDGQVSGVGVNPRHRALTFVKVWELAALAEELEARSLVVAVFPGSGPFGSHRTRASRRSPTCAPERIARRSCWPTASSSRGDRCWSLRELGLAIDLGL